MACGGRWEMQGWRGKKGWVSRTARMGRYIHSEMNGKAAPTGVGVTGMTGTHTSRASSENPPRESDQLVHPS
jgi:hypothetical protein